MMNLFLEVSSPSSNNAMDEIIKYILTDESGSAVKVTLIAIILISVAIVLLILFVGRVISKLIDGNEFIKLGPVTIKSKKTKKDLQNTQSIESNSKVIDIKHFMNIMDIIMSVELEKIITDSIHATNEIHKIEEDYDQQAESIFSKTYITVQNEYHDRLVMLACEKTGFDINKIKNTREYFFIIDLLREYKDLWKIHSKEITKRNGFITFLDDKSKSKVYIEELEDCILQCIDIRKLESTDLRKSDIEKVIMDVSENIKPLLERMFYTLATIKKQMLTKRKDKLEYINNMIKNSAINILKDIDDKILKADDHLVDDNTSLVHPEDKSSKK